MSAPTSAEEAAMQRALDLARTRGVPPGPNPRVGCVILDAAGVVAGEGHHRGAGTPHAEIVALAQAGGRAAGGTAVVTLEPCRHVGQTGPCTLALLAAGIARVVYGVADPGSAEGGGAEDLAAAGVDVVAAHDPHAAEFLVPWLFARTHPRPFVTWKVATTLDGRVAAADGSSRWITGPEARADVHRLRADADAVLVGTGTLFADDPDLTVRQGAAQDGAVQDGHQPLRAVMGLRPVPDDARVRDPAAPFVHLATRDPAVALAELRDLGVHHVLLEGGPTLAAAFVSAGLVDRVVWYVAPALLASGPSAVSDLGITTIGSALRLAEVRVDQVGQDARIVGRPDSMPRIVGRPDSMPRIVGRPDLLPEGG